MTDIRQAAQQALEALEHSVKGRESDYDAMDALRAALAEPEEPVQEPVAWQWLDTAHFRKKIPPDATPSDWRPLYTAPLQRPAEPAQTLVTALKDLLVNLIAAHSLLKRGGKQAAGSNTTFRIVLDDYALAIERGRAVLLKHVGG